MSTPLEDLADKIDKWKQEIALMEVTRGIELDSISIETMPPEFFEYAEVCRKEQEEALRLVNEMIEFMEQNAT